jgi:hypothetical protein
VNDWCSTVITIYESNLKMKIIGSQKDIQLRGISCGIVSFLFYLCLIPFNDAEILEIRERLE